MKLSDYYKNFLGGPSSVDKVSANNQQIQKTIEDAGSYNNQININPYSGENNLTAIEVNEAVEIAEKILKESERNLSAALEEVQLASNVGADLSIFDENVTKARKQYAAAQAEYDQFDHMEKELDFGTEQEAYIESMPEEDKTEMDAIQSNKTDNAAVNAWENDYLSWLIADTEGQEKAMAQMPSVSEQNEQADRIKGYKKDLSQDYNLDELEYYMDTLRYDQNAKEILSTWDNITDPVGASLTSVFLNYPKTLEGLVNTINYVYSKVTGNKRPMSISSSLASAGQKTLRDNVAENTNSPIGEYAYRTLMSGADALAMLPFGKASNVLDGLSAAADTQYEIKSKGGTDAQAMNAGLVKFLTKVATGITLNESSDLSSDLSSYVVEGMSDEFFDQTINSMTMGESSDFNQLVKAYEKQGLSRMDAYYKAGLDILGYILSSGNGHDPMDDIGSYDDSPKNESW